MLKEKNYQPWVLYPTKISFRNEGEIKIFSDEGKRIEFIASRSALKELLKEGDQIEEIWHRKGTGNTGNVKYLDKYNRLLFLS